MVLFEGRFLVHLVLNEAKNLQVEAETVLLVIEIHGPCQQNSLSWLIVVISVSFEEALLASGAQEAKHDFANLILLQADSLGHAICPS